MVALLVVAAFVLGIVILGAVVEFLAAHAGWVIVVGGLVTLGVFVWRGVHHWRLDRAQDHEFYRRLDEAHRQTAQEAEDIRRRLREWRSDDGADQ